VWPRYVRHSCARGWTATKKKERNTSGAFCLDLKGNPDSPKVVRVSGGLRAGQVEFPSLCLVELICRIATRFYVHLATSLAASSINNRTSIKKNAPLAFRIPEELKRRLEQIGDREAYEACLRFARSYY
jgi:hypothetical protein